MQVIGKGTGFAFAVIGGGQEQGLIGLTAINEAGEIWFASTRRCGRPAPGRWAVNVRQ